MVMGCTNRDVPENRRAGMKFHKLPTKPVRCQAWLTAIGRPDWASKSGKVPASYHRVCSQHFLESDYKPREISQEEGPSTRAVLRNDAVPSVFEFEHVSKASVKLKGGSVDNLPVTTVKASPPSPEVVDFDFVDCDIEEEHQNDDDNPFSEIKLEQDQPMPISIPQVAKGTSI